MDGNLAEQHAPFFVRPPDQKPRVTSEKVAVIGLGYVGLPIGVGLSGVCEHVIGFDIDRARVAELTCGLDRTNEISRTDLLTADLRISANANDLAGTTLFIVAVPTPVDAAKRPDFGPLKSACRTIAPFLQNGAIVLFESTVYPGATEEICKNELERFSGYKEGSDFHVAYSPERINPGDKINTFQSTKKVVGAKTSEVFRRIETIYAPVIKAGIFRARSIEVAEAAKVFENTQRDVNIALMNEFALICDKLGIRTRDVVEATGTKWNALGFTPGLVGGHCIGVDPHYLITRANEVGVHAEIMHASRRRNDGIVDAITDKVVTHLLKIDKRRSDIRIGILGITFKENVPDLRNSRVFDLLKQLRDKGFDPLVNDPVVRDAGGVPDHLRLSKLDDMGALDALILAVPHDAYRGGKDLYLQELVAKQGMIVDVRSALDPELIRDDITYWSL